MLGLEALQELLAPCLEAGAARDLLSRGLIPAGFLSGLKARVFLSLLLAAGADTERARVAFNRINASVSSVPSPPGAR
jgi:hypothetical protein